MNIIVTFISGSSFTDRASDMHNAVPRAEEWLNLSEVVNVQIMHQQQIIWKKQK